MTEQERTELIEDVRENEALDRKNDIRQSIWAVKAHIDLIRQELIELEGLGVKVSEVVVHGHYMDYGDYYSDITMIPGKGITEAAEAFAIPTQPWGTDEHDRSFMLEHTEVRGRR